MASQTNLLLCLDLAHTVYKFHPKRVYIINYEWKYYFLPDIYMILLIFVSSQVILSVGIPSVTNRFALGLLLSLSSDAMSQSDHRWHNNVGSINMVKVR